MCAASVYPEPGSNSLVYGIYIFLFRDIINLILFANLICFLLFFLVLSIGLIEITAWSLKGYLLFTFQCSCSLRFRREHFLF